MKMHIETPSQMNMPVSRKVDMPGSGYSDKKSKREQFDASDGRSRRSQIWTGRYVLGIGSILFLVILWTLVTNLRLVSPTTVPTPQTLGSTFENLAVHGYRGYSLASQVWASLELCLVGFVIGSIVGIILGFFTGYYKAIDYLVSPIVAIVRPIPPLAYLPLLVIFLGIGSTMKIILVSSASFSYMLLTTANGIRGVPQNLLQAGQMLGLSRRQLAMSVQLRSATPEIITGLHISIILSWGIVVAAQLIAASKGLGFMAIDAATYYRTNVVYVAIILIGIIGAIFEIIIRKVQSVLTPWYGK